MNLFNTSYLLDGSSQISYLLQQFIGGSSDIFGRDNTLILKLNYLTIQLKSDKNPQRYKILLQNKFDKMLLYTMETALRKRNFELLESILNLLVIITNNSEEFVTALMGTNFRKILIDCTIIFVESKNILTNFKFINLYLIIIFNIIRHNKFREDFQRHSQISKFKDGIIQFFGLNEQYIKITSYMIFGFLTSNDKDKKILVKHIDIVDEILFYLSNAFINKEGTFKGYIIWELLIGLKSLCDIDEINEKIIDINGFILTIIKIASSNSSKSEDVILAIEILENLCTVENVQKILLNQYHLDRVIDPLTNSGVDSIKTTAKRLLSYLKPFCDDNDSRSEYDAVISYCDLDREVIYKISMKLKETKKFNLTRLLPETNDYEARINRSKVLIVGVSNSFQKNVRCLSQVLYAHKSGKMIIPLMLLHKLKLNNLLESVIGTNECIDFSDCTMFMDSMNEMVERLCMGRDVSNKNVLSREHSSLFNSEMVKIFGQIECEPKSMTPVKRNTTKSKPSILTTESSKSISPSIELQNSEECGFVESQKYSKVDFEYWSKDQVSEWLSENDLSEVHNKFNNFNGSILKSLMDMKEKSPPTYYDQMTKSMGLEFFEVLKFDAALSRIG